MIVPKEGRYVIVQREGWVCGGGGYIYKQCCVLRDRGYVYLRTYPG